MSSTESAASIPAVELSGLGVTYGGPTGREVLRGIDLSIAPGEIVCIDFGLARHDQLPDLLAEEFTIPMGTFPYMAPEQYLRQRDDLRTDIFTLGALFYELATGRQPWGDPGSLRGVRKRLWRDPPPLRALRPDLPEWFQEIVLRCLEVDPKARYQSAGQLLFDLQNPGQVRLTARAALLWPGADWQGLGLKAAIFAPRGRLAMAGLTVLMDPGPDIAAGVHPMAIVDPTAEIGAGAAVGPDRKSVV